jgi:DNA-directed RNA polymerase subunit omega
MKAELVEKASEKVTNPQVLINAVSKRVRQLNLGRPALVRPPLGERYGQADIALLEIIEGKLQVDSEHP